MDEPTPVAGPAPEKRAVRLRTVAGLFLRLGATSFGGPAAHIALMEDEVVRRRGWLTAEEFLDLVGATNLIPGPNSTELAIHIGHRVAGWKGLVAAGVCFILPAALIVSALAWAYTAYGRLPPVAGVLYGVKPVVIAVVLQALWRFGRSAVRTPLLVTVVVVAVALVAAGVHELVVLFGAGLAVPLLRGVFANPREALPGAFTVLAVPSLAAAGVTAGATSFGLWPLFLVFLKVGSVLFGSGYVLLAFLRADLVERYGWLTEQKLLDAVAVGQVTPGPVFTTATFVGYILGGPAGAAVATVGIFLPAFVFVTLSVPLLPRLRRSAAAGAFLDGVNTASLALMAVVTWQLGRAAIVDGLTAGLAAAAAVLLLRFKMNPTWLVLGGAAVGLVRAILLAV
jgi:chromate transporter